jgi:hypothetical protein
MKKDVTNFQISGNLMKILSLIIMLAFIAPVMTNAQAGKANFAGTWTYNAEKSTPPPAQAGGGQGGGGGRGGFGGGNFVATQDANTLTRVTTRTGQDGTPVTRTTVYTLDGKENTLAAPAGGGGGNAAPTKYVATWSADGKSLTIVTTRTFNDTPMKTTEVWTLTDAKTLSIVNSRPGQDGAVRTTTAVYEIK